MDITILSQTIPNWRHGDGSFVFRVEVEDSFFAANGEHISGASNGNCFEVSANASGGVCVTDQIVIPSTTDALDNQLVRYKSAAIYKRSIKKHTILEDFVLSDELAPSTDFPTIAIRNNNFIAYQDLSGYSKAQVDALIQNYVNVSMPDASVLTKGRMKLSAAPVSPTNPIALGTNDPLVTSQSQTRYGNAYASFNAAIAAIGGAKTKLVISTQMTVGATIEAPRNISIFFEADGMLMPSAGVTVTINLLNDPGNRQVFGGLGNVIIEQNAAAFFNLAWWTGHDDTPDATKPINNLIASLGASGGGEALIPIGMWKTSGNIVLPLNCTLRGVGNLYSGIKLTSNNQPIIKIQSIVNQHVGDFAVKNLNLDCSGVTGGTGLLLTGVYPWSAKHILLEDLRFTGGDVGIDFNATDSAWELQHLSVIRPQFVGCGIAYRGNSLNSDVVLDTPLFYLPVGGTGIYVGAVGSLTVRNPNIFGSSVSPPNVPPTDNSTFLYLFGARNNITVTGGQDENIEYYLRTSTNAYPIGVLSLKDNLIQSKLKASANTTLISEGNTIVYTSAGAYQNDSGVAFVIYSKNDALMPRNLDGSPNPALPVNVFTGTTSRLARVENLTDNTAKYGEFVETRPGSSLAGITQTITPAFANTQKPAQAIYGEGVSMPFLEMSDISGANQYGYQFYRDSSDSLQVGWLVIAGNQTGFKGVYFDLPCKILGDTIATLTAAQTLTNKILSGAANTFSNIPQSAITNLTADLGTLTTNINLKAPLASPTLTGTPAAPTAATSTNTTQIATTAFVQAQYAANHLTGSASLDFPSIAAVSQADLTITVTGAALGDSVTATPNGAPEAGLVWNAFVSAANTVTIRMSNITAGAINPAARSWKVTVIK